jgi:hypothetical protein
MNPLWIVDITYVEMIDGVYMWQLHVNWIMDVVGDCIYIVCDHMLYLFLYLDCKELCGDMELYDIVGWWL